MGRDATLASGGGVRAHPPICPVPYLEVRDRPVSPRLAVSLFYDPRRTDAPRSLAAESNGLISCGRDAVSRRYSVTASDDGVSEFVVFLPRCWTVNTDQSSDVMVGYMRYAQGGLITGTIPPTSISL